MSQSSHQCVPATRAARVGVRASRAAGTRAGEGARCTGVSRLLYGFTPYLLTRRKRVERELGSKLAIGASLPRYLGKQVRLISRCLCNLQMQNNRICSLPVAGRCALMMRAGARSDTVCASAICGCRCPLVHSQ